MTTEMNDEKAALLRKVRETLKEEFNIDDKAAWRICGVIEEIVEYHMFYSLHEMEDRVEKAVVSRLSKILSEF